MNKFSREFNQIFKIPFEWLSLNLFIAFLTGNYTTYELYGFGQQLLIRTHKKSLWIASKYFYGVYTVVLVYFIGYLIMLIFSLACGGNLNFLPNIEFCWNEYGVDFSKISRAVFFKAAIIQPIMVSIAVTFIQITLSWILKPIISYLFVAIYFIASAYFQSYILIGNHSMLLRNLIFKANGLDGNICVVIDITIICTVLGIGIMVFKNCDIVKKI